LTLLRVRLAIRNPLAARVHLLVGHAQDLDLPTKNIISNHNLYLSPCASSKDKQIIGKISRDPCNFAIRIEHRIVLFQQKLSDISDEQIG
jgi:hypothetical protein